MGAHDGRCRHWLVKSYMYTPCIRNYIKNIYKLVNLNKKKLLIMYEQFLCVYTLTTTSCFPVPVMEMDLNYPRNCTCLGSILTTVTEKQVTAGKLIEQNAYLHRTVRYQYYKLDRCEFVCPCVTDVTSLPQRVLWERDYKSIL